MIQAIRALLKGAATSAADLQAALQAIDIPALAAARDALAAERTELLLSGSDSQLVAAERKLATAKFDVERAEAASQELTRRIAAAVVQEAEASLRERHAKLRAEAADITKWVVDEYPALAAKIAAMARAEADLRDRQGKFSRDVTQIESNHGKTEIDGAPHFWRAPFAEADPERSGETLLGSFLALPPQGKFEGYRMGYYT